MNIFKFFLFLLPFSLAGIHAQVKTPKGHSHNDYLQHRPLYEAIELGYGSIEIDICLDHKNELKVAHIPWFLSGKKNIEELYFAPIAKMIDERDPRFTYTAESPLHLLIDFKKNADSTYKYLRLVFIKYANYITQYRNGAVIYNAPLVINITGNKPWEALRKDSIWYARIDGPLLLADPGNEKNTGFNAIDSSHLLLIGRVASNYRQLLQFRKKFKTEEEFYAAACANMDMYHMHGITTRFYEVPNNEQSWARIARCGVYWTNVDKLKEFSDFYTHTLLKNSTHEKH